MTAKKGSRQQTSDDFDMSVCANKRRRKSNLMRKRSPTEAALPVLALAPKGP
jgi:hypothetical protein